MGEAKQRRLAKTGITDDLHGDVLARFNAQLLIVTMKRLRELGHDLRFPVSEVDDTGGDLLAFQIIDGEFRFELQRKT